MASEKLYRVFVADDHQMFIDGIISVLKSDPKITIAGFALTGEETLKKVRAEEVDVLLLDLNFPDRKGIDILEILKRVKPGIKIIILTMHREELFVKMVLSRGANGYLIKNTGKKELLEAIGKVLNNEIYVGEFLSGQLKENLPQKEDFQLSHRELEVLQLISLGFTNGEIADKLNLSVHTTDSHRKNILKKLNAKNTAELVRVAFKAGIIE
jgi:DNA-binding NarL/FixJ family response regulator